VLAPDPEAEVVEPAEPEVPAAAVVEPAAAVVEPVGASTPAVVDPSGPKRMLLHLTVELGLFFSTVLGSPEVMGQVPLHKV
jgi:hypothetical protein